MTDETRHWERNFREQMKVLREKFGYTQTDLARTLRYEGLPFHQQTVQKVESGERPVRLDEAYLIADVLQTDLESMVQDPELAARERALKQKHERLFSLCQEIASGVSNLVTAREDLARLLVSEEGNGELDPEIIARAQRALEIATIDYAFNLGQGES